MSIAPIAVPALYEQVAEQLRKRIFAHELAPGDWIDEQALAAEYGISRTPLREALKVLASEGLVTLKPRRGCYVTEIESRDLDEIFTLMALLEGQAAGDAARRADAGQRASLLALHARLATAASAGDLETFFDINQAFHRRIIEIADNRWLAQMMNDLRKVIRLSRHHSLFSQGRIEQALIEHQALVDALIDGDAERARNAMRAHIEAGRSAALEALEAV